MQDLPLCPLGAWILKTQPACCHLRKWADQHSPIRTLRHEHVGTPNRGDYIEGGVTIRRGRDLSRFGCDSGRLVAEVAESAWSLCPSAAGHSRTIIKSLEDARVWIKLES